MEDKKIFKSKNFIQNKKNFFRFLVSSNLPLFRIIIMIGLAVFLGDLLANTSLIFYEITMTEMNDIELVWKWFYLSAGVLFATSCKDIYQGLVRNLIGIRMQTNSLEKFLSLETVELDEIGTSTLISRVIEDSYRVLFIFDNLIGIITYSMLLITYTQGIMESAGELGKYIYPSIVVAFLTLFISARYLKKSRARYLLGISDFVSYMSEKLSDIKFIKARNTEEEEIKKSKKALNVLFWINFKTMLYSTLVKSTMSALQPIIFKAAILIVGSRMVLDGEMEINNMIAILYSAVYIPEYVTYIASEATELVLTTSASDVLTATNAMEPEDFESGKLMEEPQKIVLKDVKFAYLDGKEVLKGINISIPQGKVTAIVGGSGSGKTTILKLLERLYKPSSGQIMLGEDDALDINLRSWRKSFGYIVQNSPLVAGTIRDNIMYGVQDNKEHLSIEEVCELSHISEFVKNIEGGLDAEVGELGSKLSGGQRQRVAIARALIANNHYLLLDEATASLDKSSELKIVSSINKHVRDNNKTLVVVAHNLSTIKSSDNIIVLEEGKVVGSGNHDELYNSSEVYKRYVDLQS